MSKPVVHFEIGCDNLSETVEFYKDVFNWIIIPNSNSATIETGKGGGIPGHITELGHDPRKYINIYIETETLADDLKLIESKGGKKLVGPTDLPDGRTFAWFQDLAGNTIGLITPPSET
jgi:predicted enzyme related to lactoylglutathione lyase